MIKIIKTKPHTGLQNMYVACTNGVHLCNAHSGNLYEVVRTTIRSNVKISLVYGIV